jgi:hypothetical protein
VCSSGFLGGWLSKTSGSQDCVAQRKEKDKFLVEVFHLIFFDKAYNFVFLESLSGKA